MEQTGHDMASHDGHDMASHDGHNMSGADTLHGQVVSEGAAGGDSHFLYMNGGHGDGVLQAGVDEVLLFKGAATSSSGSLVLACLVLLVLAVLLEYLRLLAWWLESRYVRCSGGRRDDVGALTTCNGSSKQDNAPSMTSSKLMDTGHAQYSAVGSTTAHTGNSTKFNVSFLSLAALSILHVIIYVYGTCLMLITMTFNVYLIMALAVGVATGKIATMFTRARLLPSKS